MTKKAKAILKAFNEADIVEWEGRRRRKDLDFAVFFEGDEESEEYGFVGLKLGYLWASERNYQVFLFRPEALEKCELSEAQVVLIHEDFPEEGKLVVSFFNQPKYIIEV